MTEPVTAPITFKDPADPHSGLLFTHDVTASSIGPSHLLHVRASDSHEVMRIDLDGTISWSDKYPGLNWVTKLSHWEVDRLRQILVNASASTSPAIAGDAAYLMDFLRYLLDAIKRNHASGSGYSIGSYQLGEEVAKLLNSVGLGRSTSGYSAPEVTQYATRVDVERMHNEITALESKLAALRDEINHKDKLWGSF